LKKNLDALVSREVHEKVEDTVNRVSKFADTLKDTFSNSMPTIKAVFTQYPYDVKLLKSKYSDFESQLEVLENKKLQLNEDNTATEAQIVAVEQEMQELSWKYYKKALEEKEPDLAEVLQELREKEFDYSLIDRTKLQNLLYWIKDRKVEEMEKNNIISGIFNIKQPVDEMYFKDFMNNLVDINQTEIKIPNGNVVFKVTKHIKT
jgi:G3E family GTPase